MHYITRISDGGTEVLDFHHPQKIIESLEMLSLELSDQPEPLGQLLAEYRDALKYGVKTGKAAKPYMPHWSHCFVDA